MIICTLNPSFELLRLLSDLGSTAPQPSKTSTSFYPAKTHSPTDNALLKETPTAKTKNKLKKNLLEMLLLAPLSSFYGSQVLCHLIPTISLKLKYGCLLCSTQKESTKRTKNDSETVSKRS